MTDLPFLAVEARLKNGTLATVRLLQPDDRARMAAAVRGLNPQTIYTRLFSARKELTEAGLDRIMRMDPDREVVLVATVGSGADEVIVGGGRYVVTSPGPGGRAEIAFTVEEDYQGQGVAGNLFTALGDLARGRGIATFDADVLAENPSMLRVFVRSGLPVAQRREGDVVHLEITLA